MDELGLRTLSGSKLAGVLLVVLAAVSACGDDDSGGTPTTAASPSTVSVPGEPTGIVAIGHSGLTGYNADPERPGKDTKEFSWATGTVPEVNSIYQRMVAIRPETEGHVFNAAVGGAESKTLADQATKALADVPTPAIVIILTIDNDIRCDGSDAEHVDEFGENVGEALRIITEASPDSKIIMASFFGRPSPEDVIAITAERPDLKRFVTGSGECDWYAPSGEIAPDSFTRFNAIVDGYEAEQARVCATVPQCSTDGGAATRWADDPIDDYSDDFTHLNIGGLAGLSEAMWPVVAERLGSP